MSTPDSARMADQSWPDRNWAFRRTWEMPRFLPKPPPKHPRTGEIRVSHDWQELNSKGGVMPPFGVSWRFARGEQP